MQPLRITRKPVPKDQVDQAVEAAKKAILSSGPVLMLFLFGSSTRSDMSDQSDIDLLVVVEKASDIRPMQKKLRTIQTLTAFPIDLVWVEKAEFERKKDLGGICFIAHNEGYCIYRTIPIQDHKTED